jgi:hypothetical protein
MALRPGGPLLVVTRRGGLVDLCGPKPRGLHGVVGDLTAIDWQVVKQVDYYAAIRARVDAAAAASAPAGEGDVND